ncbi:MAG: GTPase ObgE [Corynebacterium sp.]|nr:GTPase ObgE [Corynebacterium sp.]
MANRFIDRVVLHLMAGDGGNGVASVHREKFKPLGGPDGGNGGHGGDIILEVSEQVHTLMDFHFRPHLKASRGGNGSGDWRNGARGKDLVLPVPAGTVVYSESGEEIADLTGVGMRFIAAAGGHGGLGNAALASASRKAPGFALKGEPGEQHDVVLELKSIADVGLVGFPSAGKSSLIAVLSAARPKIADYPFTTLQPNLGVVTVGHDAYTIADVPGLIPGASEGKGLGLDFLRHIERTSVLVHVVDCATMEPGRDPLSDIAAMEQELASYAQLLGGESDLMERQRVIALNKADLPDARELAEFLRAELEDAYGWPIFIISTVSREGLEAFSYKLMELVAAHRAAQPRTKAEPVVVARPVDRHPDRFEVTPLDGGWLVTGTRVERWILQTDFDNDEAVGYLGDRLAKAGVEDALFAAGAEAGDTVTIGEISFEWDPLTAAGVDPLLTGRGTDVRLEGRTRLTAAERKRASKVRRGLIEEEDFGQEASTERWQG